MLKLNAKSNSLFKMFKTVTASSQPSRKAFGILLPSHVIIVLVCPISKPKGELVSCPFNLLTDIVEVPLRHGAPVQLTVLHSVLHFLLI
jgi:hypothetical protein